MANLPWLSDVIGDEADVPAHRSVLDELVPDHAIALWDVGGHAMLANTRALELVGIDAATPDPEGGTIERDSSGHATGILRELATNLILENATALTVDQYQSGISDAIERLNSLGITSVNEVWANPTTVAALSALDKKNGLNARVTASIAHPVEFTTDAAKAAAHATIETRTDFEGERLQVPYVKFVLDGSAGGQTLVLVEPYLGTDFRGEMRNSEEIVMTEVSRLHALGIGSVLHAVGDGAVRIALNAVEAAQEQHGDTGVRHVIAHSVFVNPEDLGRFAELGVIAEFSPYFWWPSEGQELLRHELGEERLGWGFPIREMLAQGTRVSAGSDWPVVSDPNPFPAIEAMVTRRTPTGSASDAETFGPEHAVTLEQALEIFTLGGAYEHHQENDTGSIVAGKYADFVVLDRDLFAIPVDQIDGTVVQTTVLEGNVVFRE